MTAAAVVLAWAGMAVHDVYELPALVPASPQFTLPSAMYLALGAAWILRPLAATRWLLGVWLVLNLVGGGILSVLPLPFLPWAPEQSFSHYAVHLVYALTQLPALRILARALSGPVVRGTGRSDWVQSPANRG